VKSFFPGYRPKTIFLWPLLLSLLFISISSCGELAGILPGTTEEAIDPNTNLDSDGRKVAGGCNLSSRNDCYQYSNEDGYGTGGTDYLENNCNASHLNGDWIPRGCPTSSIFGYCERNYSGNMWSRQYFYIGHTMNYAELVALCQNNEGMWRDP